jgi:2-dehydro-3-deoxyphosphogluconate aldolase/(4S)-4-hydroxy-2-oxoglutarate aldolase
MTADQTRQRIERGRVVAVLQGDFAGRWLEVAAALTDGGISAIEITLDSPGAPQGIEALRHRYSEKVAVGAGMVINADQVSAAIGSGAQFVAAPNTNINVVDRCLKHDVLAIPGAYTATEIEFAHRMGAGMARLFPAMPIGPEYVRNLRGSLPTVPLLCAGGIQIENAVEFLLAGANAIGLSGALVSQDVLQPDGLDRLRERARRLMNLVAWGVS